jgi:hypothetical protein
MVVSAARWWGVDDGGWLVVGGLDGGAGWDAEGGVASIGDDGFLEELSVVVEGEADGFGGGPGVGDLKGGGGGRLVDETEVEAGDDGDGCFAELGGGSDFSEEVEAGVEDVDVEGSGRVLGDEAGDGVSEPVGVGRPVLLVEDGGGVIEGFDRRFGRSGRCRRSRRRGSRLRPVG